MEIPTNYPGFEYCIELLLSGNPLAHESAYDWLTSGDEPRVREKFKEIVELLNSQTEPRKIAKILEILGDTKREEAIPVLQKYLKHYDPHVREWAAISLTYLPFEKAAQIVKESEIL